MLENDKELIQKFQQFNKKLKGTNTEKAVAFYKYYYDEKMGGNSPKKQKNYMKEVAHNFDIHTNIFAIGDSEWIILTDVKKQP